MNHLQIKNDICDTGKLMWKKNFCAANDGNISVMLENGNILCTPTGVSKGFMTPEMITENSHDGIILDTNNKYKTTSELKVHLSCYKARDDIKAVIHSHSNYATAFSIVGKELPEGIYPESEVILGRVKISPYALQSTQKLADNVFETISEDTQAVLMSNHGSLCFGKDLQEAFYRLEVLEAYCKLLSILKTLGTARNLTAPELNELIELKKRDYAIKDNRNSKKLHTDVITKLNNFFN